MAVDYEKEGRIATITLNRPDVMNALDRQAFKELRQVMEDFRDDPQLWVGIITGAGDRAFSSGADLKATKRADDADRYPLARGLEIYKPLIAAINGYCLGAGLEMALLCDIRIAAEHTRFGLPEVTRGRIPDNGGTQKLIRMLTWCHAAEIVLTGKLIDAQEAYRIGLVNRVVALNELMPTARKLAEAICQTAPLALTAAKKAMLRGANMSLEDGLELEHALAKFIRSTEDYAEATRAFVEKRKPEYKMR